MDELLNAGEAEPGAGAISSLSLLGGCVMEFRLDGARWPLYLPPRSLLVMAGPALHFSASSDAAWNGYLHVHDHNGVCHFNKAKFVGHLCSKQLIPTDGKAVRLFSISEWRPFYTSIQVCFSVRAQPRPMPNRVGLIF